MVNKMKAICNTSPIIGLSIIGHLELLWELFDIYIPQEVYNEVVNDGSGVCQDRCRIFFVY